MARWLPILREEDLPRGRGRAVRALGRELALFRTSHGAVLAVENRCPHRGGPLAEGLLSDHHVFCPLHGWKIDLVTGAAVAPDRGCVALLPVELRDGRVLVDAEALAARVTPRPLEELCGTHPDSGRPRLGRRRATPEDFTIQDFDREVPVLAVEPPSPDTPESLRLEIVSPRGRHAELTLYDLLARHRAVDAPTHLTCLMFGFTRPVTWRGVRLADVLAAAVPRDILDATPFFAFYSWDTAATREGERFFESLPRAYALDPRTLLAFGMNGAALPKEHGGPLRLVVPFLQGYKSVKWLVRIALCPVDPVGYKKRHGFIEFPELQR